MSSPLRNLQKTRTLASQLTGRTLFGLALVLIWLGFIFVSCSAEEPPGWYYREGPLRGSLKSDSPLPLYDADPAHLWNRLFAVFYIRPSELPSRPEYPQDPTALVKGKWDHVTISISC
jgi:hypothetical protein